MFNRDQVRAIHGTLMHAPGPGDIEVIENALVEIDPDGTIANVAAPGSVGYSEALSTARAGESFVSLEPGQFLLPGFVDLHIHAPQWPQLGKALHLPLHEWLAKNTFPLEARYADTKFARSVYRSLVTTLLANGTTTAVYFGTIHADANRALADLCLSHGQRAFVGKVAMDDPDQCPDDYRDTSALVAIEETRDLISYIRSLSGNEAGLVKPIVTPRFIPSCSDPLLEGLGALAESTGCHIQTHCSESDWEHNFVLDRLGKTDTGALESFGLLGRHTILAHSNFITDDDADRIVHAHAGVAHCPLSNFYFANSVFPLRVMMEKGMHLGLGTDISGGPSASMFDSCRHAISASRALEDGVDPKRAPEIRGRPQSRIDFRHAFWLATAGGGNALDIPVGKFAKGYHFDAMVLDINTAASNVIWWQDLDSPEDIFQKIVYGATRSDISHVWVGAKSVSKGATG